MNASTKQRPSFLVLGLMTLMILLVSISSFFDVVIMADWADLSETVAIVLPGVLFITLIYVLVKYGYIKHLQKYQNRLALTLTLVSVLLLFLPTSYIIGTQIFRERVLDGNYSSFDFYSSYSNNSVYPGITALRIWCFTLSLLIFCCIATVIFMFRKKFSYKAIAVCAISTSIILFGFSLYACFNVKTDKNWYYGSAKALAYNTDECYKNAIKAYELCCKYNDQISEHYSTDLNRLLNGFDRYSDAKLDTLSLKNKETALENWKSLLSYNAHITPSGQYSHNLNNTESAEYFKQFWNAFKLVHTLNSRVVNVTELDSIRDKYTSNISKLKNMDFTIMGSPENLKTRNYELLTIVEQIDDFISPFITYSKHPVETKHSLVTWEGKERRKLIDARIKSFNRKYHIK